MHLPRSADVVFRVDSSIEIGTGHIMRCLTLADVLTASGFKCRFVCREHPGSLIGLIRRRGFDVNQLPLTEEGAKEEAGDVAHSHWLGAAWQVDARQTMSAIGNVPPDWLIVDHYALDIRWERLLRSSCQNLMVIDDLADREHDCDLLLDQNLGAIEGDYRPKIPSHCRVLVGARYALLRPQFARHRTYSLSRRRQGVPRRILVTLGGVDKDNATELVLRSLERCVLPNDTEITVVMGQHAPWANAVLGQADRMSWKTAVASNVEDMASVMSDADLAIGAAGSTSWERCSLGVPTILMVLAENQRMVARKLEAEGAAKVVELGADFESKLGGIVERLFSDKAALEAMSERAAAICDGKGSLAVADYVTRRVRGGI